jgi:hypothetical protein
MNSGSLLSLNRVFCSAVLILTAPGAANACSIPVFRYALERWPLANYELTVVFRDDLSEQLDRQLQKLEANEWTANVAVRRADLNGAIDAKLAKLWERQAKSKTLPWLVVRSGEAEADQADAWAGPLSDDALRQIVASPTRGQLVKHLGRGVSAVFLVLHNADMTANQKATALAEQELNRLTKQIRLPEPSPDGPQLLTALPLRVEFVTLEINRTDPAEAAFVRMLLSTEPELDKVRGPIIFPVFGRGRLLCSLFGQDLTSASIESVARFLCDKCSCQVKELNPGVDLLLAADWPAVLGLSEARPGESAKQKPANTDKSKDAKAAGTQKLANADKSPQTGVTDAKDAKAANTEVKRPAPDKSQAETPPAQDDAMPAEKPGPIARVRESKRVVFAPANLRPEDSIPPPPKPSLGPWSSQHAMIAMLLIGVIGVAVAVFWVVQRRK